MVACLSIILFCTALVAAQAAPGDHAIPKLPGWEMPLPSKMWAGNVPAGSEGAVSMVEHYMFIESEGNPSTDPLVIWTNGGPGAASFFGLFVELGPFTLDDASLETQAYNATGVPSLFLNPYRWTKLANVLILNSPPPVGYSYCEPAGPSGLGGSCGSWNDTKVAYHNHEFLKSWFSLYPEFQKNDLYLVGESYAGIYVPTLARFIVEDDKSMINLKGFAVGDGCVGTEVLCGPGHGPFFQVEFMHGHGQFSEKLYAAIQTACPNDQLKGPTQSAECKAALAKMSDQIGPYFAYALYDDCWYQNSFDTSRSYWGPPRSSDLLGGALNDYPCGGMGALRKWITHPKVKETLHVAKDAYYFSGDNANGLPYNLTEKNLLPFYKEVVENTNLRVLIYNGDTDPGINSFAAENWTSSLGFDEVQEWRPWTLDGKQRMGGYVTRYKGNFDFLTIRGSGHMVPEYKPRQAYEMLSKWLSNQDWLHYTKAPSARRSP